MAAIITQSMQASAFDEVAFFRAVHESGARALLIGRRALVLLGLPVLTADKERREPCRAPLARVRLGRDN